MGKELQNIWNVKVKTIPLVADSLGATLKQFGNRFKLIRITAGAALLEYRFLKSKATGCGSISTVFSGIVLLYVSSIIIIMIIIIKSLFNVGHICIHSLNKKSLS